MSYSHIVAGCGGSPTLPYYFHMACLVTPITRLRAAPLVHLDFAQKCRRLLPSSRDVPGGEVDARDLDDGLPRGFLAGAIVEVWLALHLDGARELPLSRGEELP